MSNRGPRMEKIQRSHYTVFKMLGKLGWTEWQSLLRMFFSYLFIWLTPHPSGQLTEAFPVLTQ